MGVFSTFVHENNEYSQIKIWGNHEVYRIGDHVPKIPGCPELSEYSIKCREYYLGYINIKDSIFEGTSRINAYQQVFNKYGAPMSFEYNRDREVHQIFDIHGVIGVSLCTRAQNDNHILIKIIYCDDGHWFSRGENAFSSQYLSSFQDLLTNTHSWLNKYCEKNPISIGGYSYKCEETT